MFSATVTHGPAPFVALPALFSSVCLYLILYLFLLSQLVWNTSTMTSMGFSILSSLFLFSSKVQYAMPDP